MEKERKELLQKQIAEVMKSEEACAELLMCGDAEKVCEVLKKYNVNITLDEVTAMKESGDKEISKFKASENGELDLDNLDDVVGGGSFWRGVGAIAGGAILGFGLGLVCGVCPAFTPAAYNIGIGYAGAAGVWVATGN